MTAHRSPGAAVDAAVDPVAALRSPAGRALLATLAQMDPAGRDSTRRDSTGRDRLGLATELRRDWPPDLVTAALTQHDLRAAAAGKFTRAAAMLFTRDGLEQASAEPVARHRAGRYAGAGTVADLCCGIGGDLVALAAGHRVVAVDRDPRHAAIARHNAEVYEVAGRVSVREADVREVDLAGVDAVFMDPARRTGDRRLPAGVTEPGLRWCLSLAQRVPAVGIKAAPGIRHDLVPDGWEAEFVAAGRDLKEAVLWSPALAGARRRATVLPGGHTLTPDPGPEVECAPPGAFLLDPNPAVTRAGLVEELARRLDAWKLDPRIGFLSTSDDRRTPFARTLRVIESAPWHERRFARRLRELDIGAVDIRRRGLAGDVDQIHQRLGLRGRRRATVVITRVDDRPWGLICVDPA